MSSSLVIRVKRKRTEEPVDTLHVTERVVERPAKRGKNSLPPALPTPTKKLGANHHHHQQQPPQTTHSTTAVTNVQNKKRSRTDDEEDSHNNSQTKDTTREDDQSTYVFTRIENPHTFFENLPRRKRARHGDDRPVVDVHEVSITEDMPSFSSDSEDENESDTKSSSSSIVSSIKSATSGSESSSFSAIGASISTFILPLKRSD
jgi:hypothetical protein